MDEKKCSFLKKIAYSFNPSAYTILTFQKAGSVIGFVMLFTLLLVGIKFANFYMTLKNAMFDSFQASSVEKWMNASFPDFTLNNGKLQMDDVVDITVEGMVIYIDDSIDEVTMSDMDYLSKNSAFDVFILGSSSNLLVYQVKAHKYREIRYDDFENLSTTKAEFIKNVSKFLNIGVIVVLVVWYLVEICVHFIIALFYFIIFLILNMFLKRIVGATQIYTTCVFAIVPYRLVELVLEFLPFNKIIELIYPIYFISVLVIGGFALYAAHEEYKRLREIKMNIYQQNKDYLYVNVNAKATEMSDDDLDGYASLEHLKTSEGTTYKQAGYDRMINLKGVMVNKSKLENADKYIQGNLKEMAVSNLQSLTGLSAEECLDIVYNWYQYYK